MSRRIDKDVERSNPIAIDVNGEKISCFVGETVAAILLTAGKLAFRHDRAGRPRGPVCNMGVCFDCMVEVAEPGMDRASAVRRRACMTPARQGLRIFTGGM